MFVDASAIVAILTGEPDAERLETSIFAARTDPITSPMAAFEAALAVSRKMRSALMDASHEISEYLRAVGIEEISITPEIGRLALVAMAQFGKGTGHPARLNLGDCFAYACAKAHNVPLLYKGDDFVHTDLV
ncbi:type II toxin-antitoxin system VapC family toxin [Methylopila sp. M107]|uniref:type II toxin-antitoxin system VapC family toxin n=1 Tax=Methylopila sp. M107 TaxID=1101190 RepID=UPI00036D5E42|nr:type II toxin-antitoxin system VapC family toxin [Methylopila sp. M107]